jgi:type II secretory pathway pseudopilin PulG
MTKKTSRELSLSDFVIPSPFDIRASSFGGRAAFTILELLIVITIIIALAGLILATVGYVQKKGARSRAEAEMAGMSAALESYKADNGIYPNTSNTTSFTPSDSNQANYKAASLDLYQALTGQNADGTSIAGQKNYMAFKSATVGRADMTSDVSTGNQVLYIRDPFGNSYGYSTSKNPDTNPNAATAAGFNPTFDLWSTAGTTTASASDQAQWIKNW